MFGYCFVFVRFVLVSTNLTILCVVDWLFVCTNHIRVRFVLLLTVFVSFSVMAANFSRFARPAIKSPLMTTCDLLSLLSPYINLSFLSFLTLSLSLSLSNSLNLSAQFLSRSSPLLSRFRWALLFPVVTPLRVPLRTGSSSSSWSSRSLSSNSSSKFFFLSFLFNLSVFLLVRNRCLHVLN